MIAFRTVEYNENGIPYVQLNLTDENDKTEVLKFENQNLTVNWINCVKAIPESYIVTSSSSIDEIGDEYTWLYALGNELFTKDEIDMSNNDYLEIPILKEDLDGINSFDEIVNYYRERNI
jgi:hypothetical protein